VSGRVLEAVKSGTASSGPDEPLGRAFDSVLGDRLVGLVVHGSAVTGDVIPGFSDFDFVVFAHGPLTARDGIKLQGAVGEIDPAPYAYIQLSRAVDVDGSERPGPLFAPGAFRGIRGEVPSPEFIFTEETLRAHARESRADVARWFPSDIEGWATATGPRRSYMLRLLMTRLKPAVRTLLIEHGEDPITVWGASYLALADMWTAHSPGAGRRFRELVESLPYRDEAATGNIAIELLEEIFDKSVSG
jgi:hypothetical protein